MTTAERTKARAMADKLTPHVNVLLVAMTLAQMERERVDKIQRKLLADTVYLVDAKWIRDDRQDERITDPKLSYLMYDDDAAEYHAKLNAIHLAEGFEDASKGFCPALVAEHTQREAEWALIEAAEEFFPGCDNSALLCGTKEQGGLETRQKYIDLLIGLCVNAPGYVAPLKASADK